MASDNWSSGTIALAFFSLGSTLTTAVTGDGCRELAINSFSLSLHLNKSIFSPDKALVISLILAPFSPTVAPITSTFSLCDLSPTLERSPGSLEIPNTSIVPSLISGTSASSNLLTKPILVLETSTLKPFYVFHTSNINFNTVSFDENYQLVEFLFR